MAYFPADVLQRAERTVEEYNYVYLWQLEGQPHLAVEYAATRLCSSYFTISFIAEIVHGEKRGVFYLSSTAESTQRMAEGAAEPFWYAFEAWFIPGVFLPDFWGVKHLWHDAEWLGSAQEFFHSFHIPAYLPQVGRWYYDTLRLSLRAFGVDNWIELSCGYSWIAYRGLDFYLRFRNDVVGEEHLVAWYVLNTSGAPTARGA